MPSLLLSRNTPQNAASVPCCSRTCRSGPLNPAIISRRSFSLGGVISKVAMASLMRYRWASAGSYLITGFIPTSPVLLRMNVDRTLDEADARNYDALVLPGGVRTSHDL